MLAPPRYLPPPLAPLPTRSVCRRRCFRRRRLCFRMSREEVLCSVELLSLGQSQGSGSAPPTQTNCTRDTSPCPYRLVLSSSSESMKLLDSSSLLSTVDALSGGSPRSRRRSPLRCPLVRVAAGQQVELMWGLCYLWLLLAQQLTSDPIATRDTWPGASNQGLQGTSRDLGPTMGCQRDLGPRAGQMQPQYPPRGSGAGLAPAGD